MRKLIFIAMLLTAGLLLAASANAGRTSAAGAT